MDQEIECAAQFAYQIQETGRQSNFSVNKQNMEFFGAEKIDAGPVLFRKAGKRLFRVRCTKKIIDYGSRQFIYE